MTYIATTLKKEITIDSIVTIHYFEYMKDFVFHGESHDFWEFLYVDKGSVLVQAGEESFTLKAGNIIFHQPNEFHAIRALGNSSPNLVAVSFLSGSKSMDFFRKKHCTLRLEERALISHLIDAAKEAFSTPLNVPSVEEVALNENASFGSQQMILIYLELFLLSLIRNHAVEELTLHRKASLPSLHPSLRKEDRFQKIQEYMQFHVCEQMTMERLCGQFSLSSSSIQNLFHKEKGCGAIEYFNCLKIQKAKEMIRDRSATLTEIAYLLSYNSLSYFSREFKKATGMAPSEYASSVKGISQSLS